jgi:hypothetical protein
MKTTLLQMIALPATLALFLNVDIVSEPVYYRSHVTAKLESGGEPKVMETDGKFMCLNGGTWSDLCDGEKKENAVIAYGSINFTEANPQDPRHIVFTTPDGKDHSVSWASDLAPAS